MNAEFSLQNLQGKSVYDSQLQPGSNSILLGNLPAGVYFYIISQNEEIKESGKLMLISK